MKNSAAYLTVELHIVDNKRVDTKLGAFLPEINLSFKVRSQESINQVLCQRLDLLADKHACKALHFDCINLIIKMQRRFPSVSLEFIEHTLLEQTQKLVSMRCYDLGYIPYVSPTSDSYIKLCGPPFLAKFKNEATTEAQLARLSLETRLSELALEELRPVLVKQTLEELAEMETGLSN